MKSFADQYSERCFEYLEQIADRLSRESDWADLAEESKVLTEELKQPPKIVIAGKYNAGKSTFINALLQDNILPTNVIRETLTQNWLQYGTKPGLEIVFKNGDPSRKIECGKDQICQELKKIGSDISDKIDHVRIHYPSKWLKNFTIIDTPGFDFNKKDDQVSLRILDKADLLIWLILAEKFDRKEYRDLTQLLSKAEKGQLEKLQSTGQGELRVLGLVNYIDTLDEKGQIQDIIERIKKFNIFDQIYPISAKWAVEAEFKNEADTTYFSSGFPDVMDWLEENVFDAHEGWKNKRIRWKIRLFKDKINDRLRKIEKDLSTAGKDSFSVLKSEIFAMNDKLISGRTDMEIKPIDEELGKLKEQYITNKAYCLAAINKAHWSAGTSRASTSFEKVSIFKKQIINILEYTRNLLQLNQNLSGKADSTHYRILDRKIKELKEMSFTIGMFGGFSSGKSTLLNKLLGIDLLPVDEDRCTSVQTILKKSDVDNPKNTLVIDWKPRKDVEKEIRHLLSNFGLQKQPFDTEDQAEQLIAELQKMKTRKLEEEKREAKKQLLPLLKSYPAYEKIKDEYNNIQHAETIKKVVRDEAYTCFMNRTLYYIDHPILENIELVDSPGIGSRNRTHAALAKDLMKQAHAAILMTEATTPFERKEEIEFLNEMLDEKILGEESSKKLFVLANKIDSSKRQSEELIETINKKFDEEFEGDLTTNNIYPISAEFGNNLEVFYDSLTRFLHEEKDKSFIEQISRIPETYLNSIISDLQIEEKELQETLESVENQITNFQNDRNELRTKLLKGLSEFNKIEQNASKSISENGLGIDDELDKIGKNISQWYRDENKPYYDRLYKAFRKYDEKTYNKERLQEEINLILGKQLVEKIFKDTASITINVLKPKLEKAQNVFLENLQNQFELAFERYYCYTSIKIDSLDAIDAKSTLPGFGYGVLGAGLFGAGALALSYFGIFAFPPLWPVALITGPLLGAVSGKFIKQHPVDRACKVWGTFSKHFNHPYYVKGKKQESIKSFIKSEIIKNVVSKNIQKIKKDNETLVNNLLHKIDNDLQIKWQEKRRNQGNISIIRGNQRLLLNEIEQIKTDYDKLKSEMDKWYSTQQANTPTNTQHPIPAENKSNNKINPKPPALPTPGRAPARA